MGSSGGGTTKQYTYNLPEYAKPYYERMMARGEAASNDPYMAYSGQRIAGFSPDQQGYFRGVNQLNAYGAPSLNQAMDATQYGINQAYAGGNYNANQYSGGKFGAQDAADYMNPFLANTLDVNKQRMERTYAEQQAQRAADYGRTSAFGGSRRFVQEQAAQDAMNSQMAGMQAQALNDAYAQAQQQYNADRAARQQAEGMSEQSQQFAASLGLQGTELGLKAAQQLAGMSQQDQEMYIQRLNMMKDSGAMQQALTQQQLDTAYNDFVNQRDYERNNLMFLNALMHGVPVTANSSVTSTQPSNTLAQIAGTGLGIAGLNSAGLTS